jgi:hypothetical protein
VYAPVRILIRFPFNCWFETRFLNRSQKFMDAYVCSLNGWQVPWAARKYRGHRVLPEGIMDEIEKANLGGC